MTIAYQLALFFVLPIPIACIAWTVTHEDVFREPREWFAEKSKTSRRLVVRKFFYLFTCEYCFSHYVARPSSSSPATSCSSTTGGAI